MSFEKVLLGKHFTAIEVFSINSGDKYSIVQVQQRKKELLISKSDLVNSTEELHTYKSKYPAVLIINNMHVLQRDVPGNESNDKKLLHKAFPNIRLEDFYYEIWRKENSSIIAICRKNYADELCQLLNKDFILAGISLGVCCISALTGFPTPAVLTTNSQSIDLINIEDFVPEQPIEYDINSLKVKNTELVGFCGILKSILKIGYSTGNINDVASNFLEDYKQKTFFQKALFTGIGFILIALIINFLLFSHYFEKTQQLNETISLNSSSVDNVIKIKQRIKDKVQKLTSFTASNTSKSSLLINDIVKDLPSSILLSEIDYHPLENRIKNEEAVVALDNIIMISGNTIDSESFTKWISEMEKFSWIKNITIASFGKDENNKTVFTIRISLK